MASRVFLVNLLRHWLFCSIIPTCKVASHSGHMSSTSLPVMPTRNAVFAAGCCLSVLFSEACYGQSVPLNVGMPYGQARAILIREGWQPHLPNGSLMLSCGDRSPCTYDGLDQSEKARSSFFRQQINLREAFRVHGWYETIHCYPTGAGWCFHVFSDVHGRELIVQTGSGAYGEVPSVLRFYFSGT